MQMPEDKNDFTFERFLAAVSLSKRRRGKIIDDFEQHYLPQQISATFSAIPLRCTMMCRLEIVRDQANCLHERGVNKQRSRDVYLQKTRERERELLLCYVVVDLHLDLISKSQMLAIEVDR